MSTLTELRTLSGFVAYEEADYKYSRDSVTLISGQNLAIGTVVGLITLAGATETHAGNTGNGAMTLDGTTPVLANAIAGVYTVKCIAAAANSGTFHVLDPEGRMLGQYIVAGAAFANQIKFTIADGAADFVVGDTFLVTVAAGSGKATALNFSALDGSQYAAGILIEAVDASAADKKTTIITRYAILKSSTLVWPAGATTAQKNTAIAQLGGSAPGKSQARGVIVRSDY